MKDYYNILGIKNTASDKEIKKAHRMLAMKFHPDMNYGDKRYSGKFIEVQEAYHVLSNPARRKDYDFNASYRKKNTPSPTSPFVDYFSINKSVVFAGDELTFRWRTSNADKVTLHPFGIVSANGQKTYRIKYSLNSSLTFRILAENTKTGQVNEAVLIVVYSGYRRVSGMLSVIIMAVVFLILYMVTQALS